MGSNPKVVLALLRTTGHLLHGWLLAVLSGAPYLASASCLYNCVAVHLACSTADDCLRWFAPSCFPFIACVAVVLVRWPGCAQHCVALLSCKYGVFCVARTCIHLHIHMGYLCKEGIVFVRHQPAVLAMLDLYSDDDAMFNG